MSIFLNISTTVKESIPLPDSICELVGVYAGDAGGLTAYELEQQRAIFLKHSAEWEKTLSQRQSSSIHIEGFNFPLY